MSESKRYRECMAEINAVLKKYDMAGAVTVVDQERAMFKYVFPTWCAIKLEGDSVRFRAKRADYPSEAAHHQALELTLHVILQFRDIAAQTFQMCQHLSTQAGKSLDFEHVPFADFDPEREH